MRPRVLTERTLRALKAAPAGKRIDHFDAIVPGFGVRVTDRADVNGRAKKRTFILVARYPGSCHPTRRSLGDCGALTLEQARVKARAWLGLIQKGIDPRSEGHRHLKAEQQLASNTFGAVGEDFIRRHLVGQRRARVSEREIRRELISRWASLPIGEIKRRDVVTMVDEIVDRGARRQAHNILGHLRTIFNWAINRGVYDLEHSPCDRLQSAALIGPKQMRLRVLSDEELRILWKACKLLGYPYGPLVKLLVITGQRRQEIADARWGEFDLARKCWTIPAERYKSNAAHTVPLSGPAMEVLRGLPRHVGGDFLFSLCDGSKPVNGFSRAKMRLDACMATELRTSEAWVLHDIRRTVRTRLSALRVPEPVAEMVIGHARSGLARVYDQHKYRDEIREALELWATQLDSITAASSEDAPVLRVA